jgi:hypothetical protein
MKMKGLSVELTGGSGRFRQGYLAIVVPAMEFRL